MVETGEHRIRGHRQDPAHLLQPRAFRADPVHLPGIRLHRPVFVRMMTIDPNEFAGPDQMNPSRDPHPATAAPAQDQLVARKMAARHQMLGPGDQMPPPAVPYRAPPGAPGSAWRSGRRETNCERAFRTWRDTTPCLAAGAIFIPPVSGIMAGNEVVPRIRRGLRPPAGCPVSGGGTRQLQPRRPAASCRTIASAATAPTKVTVRPTGRLDTREGATAEAIQAVVPGRPDASELIRRIVSTDDDEVMPPPKSHKSRLAPGQIELLRRWIAEGAAWGRHGRWRNPCAPPCRRANTRSTRW